MYRSDTAGDGTPEADDAIRKARFQAQEYVTLAGHTWTVQLSSLPEFERVHERNASTVILVAGVLLSLLLGVITHQLVTGRARAYAAAQAMTRELRESEERYRRIVETASEGIWMLDASRRLAFVNPRIAQWLGVPEDAMRGRPVDDFMDPEEAERCRAALAAQAAGEGDGASHRAAAAARRRLADVGVAVDAAHRRRRRAARPARWACSPTSTSAAWPRSAAPRSRRSCATRRRWRPSARWPAASRTTSTTSWPPSSATWRRRARTRPSGCRATSAWRRSSAPRCARAASCSRSSRSAACRRRSCTRRRCSRSSTRRWTCCAPRCPPRWSCA